MKVLLSACALLLGSFTIGAQAAPAASVGTNLPEAASRPMVKPVVVRHRSTTVRTGHRYHHNHYHGGVYHRSARVVVGTTTGGVSCVGGRRCAGGYHYHGGVRVCRSWAVCE